MCDVRIAPSEQRLGGSASVAAAEATIHTLDLDGQGHLFLSFSQGHHRLGAFRRRTG